MKSFNLFVLVTILILTAGMPANTQAIGLGLSAGYSFGNGEVEVDYDYKDANFEDGDANFDYNGYAVAFVLDTAVASDSVFNYRLGLGYGSSETDSTEGTVTNKGDSSNFAIVNTFGFSFFKNQYVRLWIGPQIGVAYGTGSSEATSRESLSLVLPVYEMAIHAENDMEYSIGMSLGPVIGANFHLGPVVSLCLDLGYGFSFNYGAGKLKSSGVLYYYGAPLGTIPEMETDYDSFSTAHAVLINFSVLFRMNDRFQR